MVQSPFTRPFGLRTFPKTILSQEIPRLLARTIYPDSTGKMILPTEARTTDLYAADHEGVYRLFESGEPAVVGGRVVRNYCVNTNDLSQSNWTVLSATKTTGVTDPDGGTEAITITATEPNGQCQDIIAADVPDGDYLTSVWIRRRTGTGQVRLHYADLSGDVIVNLTSSWQRFVVDDAKPRTLNPTFKITVTTSGDEIDIAWPQIEYVTGRSDQSTPSEYVENTASSGTALAVYATENGNSVASNVVTEAVGSALSPAPYVLTTLGATNSCAYSQDLTGTGWTDQGTPTVTQDQTDIFGNANSAWSFEDDNGSNLEAKIYSLTISADTNTNSVRCWIKKTGPVSVYPGIGMKYGGTDFYVIIDTENGTLVDGASAPDDSSISDDGDFWKVTVSHANTNQTALQLKVFATIANALDGGIDLSATGTNVFDQFEIFLNTSNAVAHALPPIPTSGSAVTTDPTEVSIDWPSEVTNNFVISGTLLVPDVSNTFYAVQLYENGSNRLITQSSGPVFTLFKIYSGQTSYSLSATAFADNVEETYAILQSLSQGLKFYNDGALRDTEAGATDDITIPTDGRLDIGGAVTVSIGQHRDIQIWSVPAGISDEAVLAL